MITFGAITTLLYHFYENVVKRSGYLPVFLTLTDDSSSLAPSRCFHDVLVLKWTDRHGLPNAEGGWNPYWVCDPRQTQSRVLELGPCSRSRRGYVVRWESPEPSQYHGPESCLPQ